MINISNAQKSSSCSLFNSTVFFCRIDLSVFLCLATFFYLSFFIILLCTAPYNYSFMLLLSAVFYFLPISDSLRFSFIHHRSFSFFLILSLSQYLSFSLFYFFLFLPFVFSFFFVSLHNRLKRCRERKIEKSSINLDTHAMVEKRYKVLVVQKESIQIERWREREVDKEKIKKKRDKLEERKQ